MKKSRVVVTDFTFPDVERERLAAENAGATFESFQCRTSADVKSAIEGATVAVVQFAPVDADAISGLADGASIIRYGIGFDNIDVAAANSNHVAVGYVPDYCLDEVAEHSCASILMMLRKLHLLDASVRDGKWAAVEIAKPMKPFSETLIGFFGFGQIGRCVFSRLQGFGFRFAVADPALTKAQAEALGIQKMSADELFSQADVVSLHAPATKDTINFVNATRLASMKPNAVIVNSARGALIDEAALAEALVHKKIAGAALDVFKEEPLGTNSPLRNAPGLLLTPHAAWYSELAISRLQQLVADDITNCLSGKALRKPVPG